MAKLPPLPAGFEPVDELPPLPDGFEPLDSNGPEMPGGSQAASPVQDLPPLPEGFEPVENFGGELPPLPEGFEPLEEGVDERRDVPGIPSLTPEAQDYIANIQLTPEERLGLLDRFPDMIQDVESVSKLLVAETASKRARAYQDFLDGKLEMPKAQPAAPGPEPELSLSRVGGAFVEGVKDAARGALSYVDALSPESKESLRQADRFMRSKGQPTSREMLLAPVRTDPEYERSSGWVEDVSRAVGGMAPQIPMAMAGGPWMSAITMGANIAGNQYDELVRQGVEPSRAMVASTANAIMQAPLEQIGLGKVMKVFQPKALFLQRLKAYGASMGTEFVTEFLQQYPEVATNIWAMNPDNTAGEQLEKFAEQFAQTTREGAYAGSVGAGMAAVLGAPGLLRQGNTARDLEDLRIQPRAENLDVNPNRAVPPSEGVPDLYAGLREATGRVAGPEARADAQEGEQQETTVPSAPEGQLLPKTQQLASFPQTPEDVGRQGVPRELPPLPDGFEPLEEEDRRSGRGRGRIQDLSREEALRELETDSLTGGKSKRKYYDDLQFVFNGKAKHAFLDADNFKRINDTLGHDAGDEAIRAINRIIDEETPYGYRIGGDEFIILGKDEAEVSAAAQRVQKRLAESDLSFQLGGNLIKLDGLGVSFGVGDTREQADGRLKEDKQARAQAGLRDSSYRRTGHGHRGSHGLGGEPVRENHGNEDRGEVRGGERPSQDSVAGVRPARAGFDTLPDGRPRPTEASTLEVFGARAEENRRVEQETRRTSALERYSLSSDPETVLPLYDIATATRFLDEAVSQGRINGIDADALLSDLAQERARNIKHLERDALDFEHEEYKDDFSVSTNPLIQHVRGRIDGASLGKVYPGFFRTISGSFGPGFFASKDKVTRQGGESLDEVARSAFNAGLISEESEDVLKERLEALAHKKKESGPRYMFAGQKAATADLKALERARAMEKDGVDNEDIRQETGWFQGPDGKWRFEIDDSAAAIVRTSDVGSLGRLLDHNEVYRAYPGIKDIRLSIDEDMGGFKGSFDTVGRAGTDWDMMRISRAVLPKGGKPLPPEKFKQMANNLRNFLKDNPDGNQYNPVEAVKAKIALYEEQALKAPSGRWNEEGLSTTLHELQHAIQDREGFARGGSPKDFIDIDNSNTRAEIEDALIIVRLAREDRSKVSRAVERFKDLLGRDPALGAESLAFGAPDIKHLESFLKKYPDKTAQEQYRSLAGEIEARDVQKRMDMTPEERKATPPDLRSDAIVRFDSRGSAASISATSEVQSHANALSRSWKNAPDISVVRDESQLPGEVYQDIRRMGGFGSVRGVYHQGKVYLVANNLSSKEEVAETVFHEALRHHGMRLVLGDRYDSFMRNAARNPRVREAMDILAGQYKLDAADPADRIALADEAIAHLADAGWKGSLWNRIVAAARRLLRKLGLKLRASDSEIRDLISRSSWAVRNGKRKHTPKYMLMESDIRERIMLRIEEIIDDMMGQGYNFADIARVATLQVKKEIQQEQEAGKIGTDITIPRDFTTKEFKAWFKNSVAVNKDGSPRVWFHGSPNGSITEFRRGAGDLGIHLGTPGQAEAAFKNKAANTGRAGTPAIYPVYASVQNPLRLPDGQWDVERVALRLLQENVGDPELLGSLIKRWRNYDPNSKTEDLQNELRTHLEDLGYDGIIYSNVYESNSETGLHDTADSLMVFRPEQIKSVFNVGSWDGSNPDIRYSQSKKVPAFFSPTERAVETVQVKKPQSGAWWIGQINAAQKKGMLRQEEVEDLGLKEWLEGVDGKVSKNMVLDFIRKGGPQIEEIQKPSKMLDSAINKWMEDSDAEVVEKDGMFFAYYGEYPIQEEFSTHEEAEDALRAEAQDQLGEYAGVDVDTKFSKYTMPGGENYREVLLTLPENKGEEYKSSHWEDSPNVLAHFRLNDRTGPGGERILFVEEIQSDWHQDGRKEGYGPQETEEEFNARRAQSMAIASGVVYDGRGNNYDITEMTQSEQARIRYLASFAQDSNLTDDEDIEWKKLIAKTSPATDEQMRAVRDSVINWDQKRDTGIPNAPFKKSWHLLAFKKVLQRAVAEGYDSVSWTTGDVQAERYDLSKHVESVRLKSDGTLDVQRVDAPTRQGKKPWDIIAKNVSENDLDNYIGKDHSQKLREQSTDEDGNKVISGLDLKVGGEGMKGFYDRILVKDIGKYVKTLDNELKVKVDQIDSIDVWSIPITDKMRETIRAKGQALYSRKLTPAQEAALAKIGQPSKPVAERVKDWYSNARTQGMAHLRQGLVDQYHSFNLLDRELKQETGYAETEGSAYTLARMSNSLGDVMYAVLHHGAPKWTEGWVSVDGKGKGLIEVFKPLGADLDMFMAYRVGVRAQKLKAEGRENLFSDDDIQALLDLRPMDQVEAKKWDDIWPEYDEFRTKVLDFAQASGLIDPKKRAVWEDSDHLPFYRVTENERKRGPLKRKGLANQDSGIRRLKGGDANIGDPYANIIHNLTHLTEAAIKNHAANVAIQKMDALGYAAKAKNQAELRRIDADKAADKLRKALDDDGAVRDLTDAEKDTVLSLFWSRPPKGENIVSVMQSGKRVFYEVDDPLLLRSIASVNSEHLNFTGLKFMRFMKRLLTMGVTVDPAFRAANLARDTFAAWGVSKSGFIPIADSLRGAVKVWRESPEMVDMMAAGGSFASGWSWGGDPEDISRRIKREMKAHRIRPESVMDTPKKMMGFLKNTWDFWERVGSASENAARVQMFSNIRKRGGSLLEAAYESKDVMDFSLRGDWKAIQFLIQTVPFMGARIQGLYKITRAAMTPSFWLKGSAVAMASMLLYLWNRDDDRFKELEEWDRDTYHHFFLGDQHYRFPKSFEFGALFSTIPERFLEYALDGQDDKLLVDRFAFMVEQTFAMNPLPQGAKQSVEVWANKNFFTGRPIEGLAMQRKMPGYRRQPWTSETMSEVGQGLGVSPQKLEHFYRGIFGPLGMYILGASDVLAQRMGNYPYPPKMKFQDYPVVNRFYKGKGPARNTKYATQFYDMLNEVDQLAATVNSLRRSGDHEQAKKIQDAENDKARMRKYLHAVQGQVRGINQQSNRIWLDTSMTPGVKRRKLDKLQERKNDILRRAYERAWPDFR